MHAVKNDGKLGKVPGGMDRAAKDIGEESRTTGVNPFEDSAHGSVAGSVEMAFGELDDLDESMDEVKAKMSMQYAVLEAAGIPRKVAKLARQVSAMTDAERRAFDASLSLARSCLGVQTELDLGNP